VNTIVQSFLLENKINFATNEGQLSTDFQKLNPVITVFPADFFELEKTIKILSANKIKFHVVSKGHNWGYGDKNSKLICTCSIDLRKMNKIIRYDQALGTLEIEPGVTQKQIYLYLNELKSPWCLDITGADSNSSIVGNYLERGFGHTFYGDHEDKGKILEAITPQGKVFNPHFIFSNESRVRGLYQHDLSLNLEKIFYQTNFAIVTKFLVKLKPRNQKTILAVVLNKNATSEFELIQKISHLKMHEVVNSIPHIANFERVNKVSEVSVKTKFKYAATIDISGTKELACLRKKLISKTFAKDKVYFFTKANLFVLEKLISWRFIPAVYKENFQNVKSLFDLIDGIPTDYFVKNSLGADFMQNPKKSLWIAPLFPISEEAFLRLKAILEEVTLKYNFNLATTVSLISDRLAVCVADITLNSNDEKSLQLGLTCYQELVERLFKEGFPLYRMGYAHSEMPKNSEYFVEIYKSIKNIFDPDDLLSPGRWLK
jgi:4-cresol dehydrogenase (hydroxylating)